MFGPSDDDPQQYVDLDHNDTNYKHYFGKLLLCFELTHEGVTRQCCMVEYLFPRELNAKDGAPLETDYITLKRKLYEVVRIQPSPARRL